MERLKGRTAEETNEGSGMEESARCGKMERRKKWIIQRERNDR